MAKRSFDVLVAFLGLLLLLPVFAAIAIAIKVDSPGPVFYRAMRVGKNGQLFAMLKFRTMSERGEGPRITAHDDPRITRIGHFLRDTKLNELPQLINVLKGQMSLVGPRPEDPEFVAHYSPEERQVLLATPGMTSPAAVIYAREEAMLSHATATESYLNSVLPNKLHLDLLYIRYRSFLLDLDVLLCTLLAVIPLIRRATPEVEDILLGPIQRLVRRYASWFLIDWCIALAGIAVAGLVWRAASVLDLGWARALLAALIMALAFSAVNWVLGVQRTAWRYASAQEAWEIVLSTTLATVLLVGLDSLRFPSALLPPGLLALAGFFAMTGFAGARYRGRLLSGLQVKWGQVWAMAKAGRGKVLVVGAGEEGQWVVWFMRYGAGRRIFDVVGIVDDDPRKRGMRIHGAIVLGGRRSVPDLIRTWDIDLIALAIDDIGLSELDDWLAVCRSTPARIVLVPGIADLLVNAGTAGAIPDCSHPRAQQAKGAPAIAAGPIWPTVDGSDPYVDAHTVAGWVADLAQYAASNRLADIQRRLAELQSMLSPAQIANYAAGGEEHSEPSAAFRRNDANAI